MKDSKSIDIETYRHWGRRILIVIVVIISPFFIALLLALVTALKGLGSDDSALGDVVGSIIVLLIISGIPVIFYVLMNKIWPFIHARQLHPKEPWLWRADWAEGKIPFSRNHGSQQYRQKITSPLAQRSN